MNADWIDRAMQFAARRKHLWKNMPKCPSCGSVQVQLTAYIRVYPAHWKCRTCKYGFLFEPN